jgi:hypothetical protein
MPEGPRALWAVFLYRLSHQGGTVPGDPAFLARLRALPYEGALFLRTIGRSGALLCWKEDTLRPRDMEGLIERVANVPAFARACADLDTLQARARGAAAARFGSRFEPRTNSFTAFGTRWHLGAAFLSLPWPLPQRPSQFLSRELVCLDWATRQTAIIAKRDRTRSGTRLPWDRRLLRPFEEVGGAAQEYPLLATARSLAVLRALLVSAQELIRAEPDNAEPAGGVMSLARLDARDPGQMVPVPTSEAGRSAGGPWPALATGAARWCASLAVHTERHQAHG